MLTSRLVRRRRFFALHYLRRADWSEAENLAAFGPLADPAGHGHDYTVTVRIAGPMAHGMVIDLALLDRLLDEVVTRPLAGRLLNRDVPEFATVSPTCEALAEWIYRRLLPRLPAQLNLELVEVAEDDTLAGEAGPA
jgi:6-pyruvoyl-tetrahydropterin synthase